MSFLKNVFKKNDDKKEISSNEVSCEKKTNFISKNVFQFVKNVKNNIKNILGKNEKQYINTDESSILKEEDLIDDESSILKEEDLIDNYDVADLINKRIAEIDENKKIKEKNKLDKKNNKKLLLSNIFKTMTNVKNSIKNILGRKVIEEKSKMDCIIEDISDKKYKNNVKIIKPKENQKDTVFDKIVNDFKNQKDINNEILLSEEKENNRVLNEENKNNKKNNIEKKESINNEIGLEKKSNVNGKSFFPYKSEVNVSFKVRNIKSRKKGKYEIGLDEDKFLDRPAEPIKKKQSTEKIAIEIANIFKFTREKLYKSFSKNNKNELKKYFTDDEIDNLFINEIEVSNFFEKITTKDASLFYTLGKNKLKYYKERYKKNLLHEIKKEVKKILSNCEEDIYLATNFLDHVNKKLLAVGCNNIFEKELLEEITKIVLEEINKENSKLDISETKTQTSYSLNDNYEEKVNDESILYKQEGNEVLFYKRNTAKLALNILKDVKEILKKDNNNLKENNDNEALVSISKIKISKLLEEKLKGKVKIKDKELIKSTQNFFQNFFIKNLNEKNIGKELSLTIMKMITPYEELELAFN